GRYHIAGSALHRLCDYSGERAAPAPLYFLGREIDAVKSAVGISQLERASVAVGIRHRELPALKRPIALLRFVADKTDHTAGLAVESTSEARALRFPGGRTRESRRGLDRLGAAAIKMCAIKSGGRDFAQQLERGCAFL